MEEENLKCVYSYELSKELVKMLANEGKITDVYIAETYVHQTLKYNNILYFNKLIENLVDGNLQVTVEVYVSEEDYIKAKKIIDERIYAGCAFPLEDINNKGEENNE